MKKIVFAIATLASFWANAQADEKMAVQKTVEDFFEAFHAQDSVKIRALTAKDITLQSIGTNKAGKTQLRIDDFDAFLNGIVGIPKERKFQEKINSYSIQVDGPMANAWTEYEFWIDGKLSHCGVNSFQMIDEGDGWKIIYLIDTRRREGCGSP
ncbi:nuclear transport factor 2 family protein [Maribacter algicola]|uniref:Nuclear transport factor 2 family protein n=1 Tax=Meishania litoralis TaxID=3434685 RepID=A0ACC7LLL1_9FLAO